MEAIMNRGAVNVMIKVIMIVAGLIIAKYLLYWLIRLSQAIDIARGYL